MKLLSLQKTLISIAISSLLLSASQCYAEVIFNNPDEDFVHKDSNVIISKGLEETVLVAKNIDLGTNTLNVHVGEDSASGSLFVKAENFVASEISTSLDNSSTQNTSYETEIYIDKSTTLNALTLFSEKQSPSNQKSVQQKFKLTTSELTIDGNSGINVMAGNVGSDKKMNTSLKAEISADTITVNGGNQYGILVSGSHFPVSDTDSAELTVSGKNVTIIGSSSYNLQADNIAVISQRGATINLHALTQNSTMNVEVRGTETTSTFKNVALYSRDGIINTEIGINSKLDINGTLVSWRTTSPTNDYLVPELNIKAGQGSSSTINGDLWAVGGSEIDIKTEGQTTINVFHNGIESQNSSIIIDIGSESLDGTEYGIRGDIGATYGSAEKNSLVDVTLNGKKNVFLGSALIYGDEKYNFVNLTLNDQARWDVRGINNGNNYISNLTLDKGILNLRFGEDGTSYKTLDVSTLSGNEGLFLVNAVLTEENEISNRVEIQNAKAGTHRIHVNSASGTEPTKPEQNGYLVRVINDEGATFVADNNKLEYGVYFRDYSIKNRLNENNETEWYLAFDPQPDEPELTPSGEAVVALAGMGAQNALYLNQLSDIRQRLGEIKNGVEDGVWASVAAQKDRISGFSSTSFEQDAYRFNLGFDRKIGQWLVGANIKAITANQETKDSQFKADGNAHSEGINLYATWYNEIGCYADLVLSLDRYHQQIENRMLNGTKIKGGYHNLGLGVSIEGGRKFSLGSDKTWFIEPQAQLSYYWMKGDDFSMSNAMEVEQDNFDSLTGRMGVAVGKDFIDSLGNNKGQFHARLGVNHEFLGDQIIRVNNIRFSDDLLGTRIYYGFAGEWKPYENIKLFGYVERENGSDYTKEFEVSAGIKYTF